MALYELPQATQYQDQGYTIAYRVYREGERYKVDLMVTLVFGDHRQLVLVVAWGWSGKSLRRLREGMEEFRGQLRKGVKKVRQLPPVDEELLYMGVTERVYATVRELNPAESIGIDGVA